MGATRGALAVTPGSYIVGLDLGTRYLGAVVALATIPLRILAADTLNVNEHDLDATARRIRVEVDGLAGAGLPPDVVVEFGPLYIPDGASAQKARTMADNHATMGRLLSLLFSALPGPVYRVTTIARRTWSARVVPHRSGGVSNADARAGLATWLDPAGAWPLISDQHRADACGALVGHLLGPTGKPHRRARSRASPEAAARRAAEAAQDAVADAALSAMVARVALAGPTPGADRERVAGRAPRRLLPVA